jgi:hypothetical protein
MTEFHFAPSDTLTAKGRDMQHSAIALRVANESSERTKITLEKHMRKSRKIAPAACAFLVAIADAGVDFGSVYSSTKQSAGSENLFNEKAIPKVWELASVLNGGAWDMSSIEGFTLHAVTCALASGNCDNSAMQRVMHKLSLTRTPTGYTGGTLSTQVSSSCRALEALGVIAPAGTRVWKIANHALFAECCRASGIDAPDTPTNDDGSEAIVIDGEAYVIEDAPALPAPMLALPAPDAVPPAKAKRVRKSGSKSKASK